LTTYDLTNEKIPLIRARNICLPECGFRIPQRQLISMILYLIDEAVETGFVLPRKPKSIRKALYFETGHYWLDRDQTRVECYAETVEYLASQVVRSVSVPKDLWGKGLGRKIVLKAVQSALDRAPDKAVVLACHLEQVGFYQIVGFRLQEGEPPEEVMGGRTLSEWTASKMVWMKFDISSYSKKREEGSHG
jgi:N-acetylglutamate synthase-like GNAT family acetyltransferase